MKTHDSNDGNDTIPISVSGGLYINIDDSVLQIVHSQHEIPADQHVDILIQYGEQQKNLALDEFLTKLGLHP